MEYNKSTIPTQNVSFPGSPRPMEAKKTAGANRIPHSRCISPTVIRFHLTSRNMPVCLHMDANGAQHPLPGERDDMRRVSGPSMPQELRTDGICSPSWLAVELLRDSTDSNHLKEDSRHQRNPGNRNRSLFTPTQFPIDKRNRQTRVCRRSRLVA